MVDQEKKESVIRFVKEFVAIEEAMEPYKSQRRDLKENYVTQGWLEKKEIRTVIKALRILKTQDDPEQILEYCKMFESEVGIEDEDEE